MGIVSSPFVMDELISPVCRAAGEIQLKRVIARTALLSQRGPSREMFTSHGWSTSVPAVTSPFAKSTNVWKVASSSTDLAVA
jgi:hypothetical protein